MEESKTKAQSKRPQKLTDLEFYVMLWRDGEHRPFNVFSSTRILHNVATYRIGKFREHYKDEPERWFNWCFGDTWGRYEWEVGFGDPFLNNDGSWDGEKTDVYTLFLEPNKNLLKKMIDNVSVTSCKTWLREYRKARAK